MEIVLTPHMKLDLVPTKVMVLGSEYKVNFGPNVQPHFHIVNKQRQCCCELGKDCPAVDAVAEYLRNGGQRAPDPMPDLRSANRARQQMGRAVHPRAGLAM